MARGRALDVAAELLEAFRRSGRATEVLIGAVPDRIWRAAPASGRGRTIAAIAAHIQSVRRTFARMGGASPTGRSLDSARVTRAQARQAIRASTDGLARLFDRTLRAGRSRAGRQPRRAIDMMTYLIQHDAHHRGQICALARDAGHEFAPEDITRLWGWRRIEDDQPPQDRRAPAARRAGRRSARHHGHGV